MKQLGFYSEHLDPVKTGSKTCTIRLGRRPSVQAGEVLELRFGSRSRPLAVLKAECTAVEHLDLTEHLEALSIEQTAAELEASGTPVASEPLRPGMRSDEEVAQMTSSESLDYLEQSGDADPALIRALRASGGDYVTLILEADDRRTADAYAVHFRLLPNGRP